MWPDSAPFARRILLSLLLGAPNIIRKERHMITLYKKLTAVGLLLGPIVSFLAVGNRNIFHMFPATVFLGLLPVALMWPTWRSS